MLRLLKHQSNSILTSLGEQGVIADANKRRSAHKRKLEQLQADAQNTLAEAEAKIAKSSSRAAKLPACRSHRSCMCSLQCHALLCLCGVLHHGGCSC